MDRGAQWDGIHGVVTWTRTHTYRFIWLHLSLGCEWQPAPVFLPG